MEVSYPKFKLLFLVQRLTKCCFLCHLSKGRKTCTFVLKIGSITEVPKSVDPSQRRQEEIQVATKALRANSRCAYCPGKQDGHGRPVMDAVTRDRTPAA